MPDFDRLSYESRLLRETWLALHRESIREAGGEVVFLAAAGDYPDTVLKVRIRDTRVVPSTPHATYSVTVPLYRKGEPIQPRVEELADDVSYRMWSLQSGDGMEPYDDWSE